MTSATGKLSILAVETLLEEVRPSAEEIVNVVLAEAADSLRALAAEYEKEDGVTRLIAQGVKDAAEWLVEDDTEEDPDDNG